MAISFSFSYSTTYLIVCIILIACSSSESLHFKITNFNSDAANILYSGDAAVSSNGTIHFNEVNYYTRVGHVKYANPVQIWDRKSGSLSDFTTHFTFIVDTLARSTYGDGIAFFLAPVDFQIPPNSAAGFLGLFNKTVTDSPRNQMIFVEFDSFPDKEWDPPFGHAGINKNSLRSANYTAWNASLHSGDPTDAWVTYNSTTYILNLIWGYGDVNTSLSYRVDLREVVPEWVSIGFSAATGTYVEKHMLQSWEFNSSLNTEQKHEDNSSKWKLTVGLLVPLAVIIIGGVITCARFWSRRSKTAQVSLETVSLTSINDELQSGAAKRFSYSELVSATSNFSDDQKLGEGGFGSVYKGYLPCEGMEVAVKKISHDSKQGKKEYMTEVKINSRLRHRNLVQLVGWCHDETQFLIVYEYMPNGSLDSHLFGKRSPLEWSVRYKIAIGLASALLYLHEEWEQCVVHRDIKPSNIMLDSGFNVKLGDFGLARLVEHELGPRTTVLAGTLGYMAPEYISTGKTSKESDVYSFGVVALEIACGRKAMDSYWNSNVSLVEWVWELHGKGEVLSGVDRLLGAEFDAQQVECLMMVGLWCAHPDRSRRPSIRQAIQVLKFESALPHLPMKMPVAMYCSGPDASDASSLGATFTNSSNDLKS
ncbi:hypothetical protein SSX86_006191 [Deinandra increscens subsp. villosa]|uniref:Protein kinase domain-containing protein n=1 Tax=Deinandra increscens subsp. villosa TaxID=3103831 RepID=A0AAP0DRE1_9ASTR